MHAQRWSRFRAPATALAPSRGLRTASGIAAGLVLLGALLAAPAAAQVAAEASLSTDYRIRGYSVTGGNPAASLSLSYDDPAGFYLGASAVATVRDGDPEIALVQAAAGYAIRLSTRASLDAGLARTDYLNAFGSGRDLHYTELYLGVSIPHLTARASYSPDYFAPDTNTLYAELEAGIEPAENWVLTAHGGVFTYLDERYNGRRGDRFDWRVGAARQFGRTSVHLDVSGRIQTNPAGPNTHASAVTGSVSRAF